MSSKLVPSPTRATHPPGGGGGEDSVSAAFIGIIVTVLGVSLIAILVHWYKRTQLIRQASVSSVPPSVGLGTSSQQIFDATFPVRV